MKIVVVSIENSFIWNICYMNGLNNIIEKKLKELDGCSNI